MFRKCEGTDLGFSLRRFSREFFAFFASFAVKAFFTYRAKSKDLTAKVAKFAKEAYRT